MGPGLRYARTVHSLFPARCVRDLALACALLGPCFAQGTANVTLAGRVVDMRGEGCTAAEVWVESPDGSGRAWRTRADGEGFYRLAVPRAVEHRLLVRAEGHCCVAHWQREPFPPQCIVLHEAATLLGVLKDKHGKPVVGAVVFAERRVTPAGMVAEATTDATGAFVLRGVALGSTRVAAWIDGEGLALAELRVGGDAEVQLVPWSGATTSMRVTLRDVAEADRQRVTLTLTGNFGNSSLGGTPERPAPFFVRGVPADGWRVEHLPDWGWIVAPYAEHVRFRPSVVTVESGQGPHTIELVAKWPTPAPTTVRAVVRDAEQRPVPGLRIGCYGSNVSSRLDGVTDADGKLVIESPWALEQPGFVALSDRWLRRLTPSGTGGGNAIELQAIAGCAVTGRVLAADGRAAALVHVALQVPGDGPRVNTVAETWSDADGRFTLCQLVAEQPLRLVLYGAMGWLQREPIKTGRPGTESALGDLRLTPGAIVEGVVLDGNDRPVVGVPVRARAADGKAITGLSKVEVVTDSRGRYRFDGMPAGAVRLMVVPEVVTARILPGPTVELESGRTHVVELRDPPR